MKMLTDAESDEAHGVPGAIRAMLAEPDNPVERLSILIVGVDDRVTRACPQA